MLLLIISSVLNKANFHFSKVGNLLLKLEVSILLICSAVLLVKNKYLISNSIEFKIL